MAERKKRRRTDDTDAYQATASPTMVNCLASWLELATGTDSTLAPRAARDANCPRADEVMMDRLQINLQKSFDPDLADRAFAQSGAHADSTGPPAWLRGILRSQQGRKLLAVLASKHPQCRLLSFATATSDSTSTATAAAAGFETDELESFLQRFADCVTGVLDAVTTAQRSPSPGDEGAYAALCRLCEMCAATDFTLVYGLHLLHVANARNSTPGKVATSARRLAQDVYHWVSTGGPSRSVHGDRAANRSNAAAPGQHLLLCGRELLQKGQHSVAGPLASMEASGVASVGEAERLYASLKREDNQDGRQNTARRALHSLRSRSFLRAMLAALFNSVRHVTCVQLRSKTQQHVVCYNADSVLIVEFAVNRASV